MPDDFTPLAQSGDDFQILMPGNMKSEPKSVLMRAYDFTKQAMGGGTPVGAVMQTLRPQSQGGQTGPIWAPFNAAAAGGRFVNQKIQQGAGASAEQLGKMGVNPYLAALPGTIAGTAAQATIPQTGPQVAASVLPYAERLGQEAASLSSQPLAQEGGQPLSRVLGSSQAGGSSSSYILPPEIETVKAQKGPILQQWAQTQQKWNEAMTEMAAARKTAFRTGNIDEFENTFNDSPVVKKVIEAETQMNAIEAKNPDIAKLRGISGFDEEDLNYLANPPAKATVAQAVKPNPPGNMAQLISAKGGRSQITPSMAQYALDHPEVLNKDITVAEATKNYADAVPGLKGKTADLAEKLDKTVIRPSDYDEAINEAGRALKNDTLTPQSALTGLQSINKALRDRQYTSGMDKGQVAEIAKVKDGMMDYLQNNGAPKIREAAHELFEAHVKEAFSGLVPKNKFGSPDSLKTMIGMGQLGTAGALAAGGIASGHPIAGLAAAVPVAGNALLSSPAVLGQLIRESGAIRNPANFNTAIRMGVPLSNMLSNTQGGQQ